MPPRAGDDLEDFDTVFDLLIDNVRVVLGVTSGSRFGSFIREVVADGPRTLSSLHRGRRHVYCDGVNILKASSPGSNEPGLVAALSTIQHL